MGMPQPRIIGLFCTKCALCWRTYPQVFHHDGNYIATIVDPNADADIVNQAIAACPGKDLRVTPPVDAKAIVWGP